MTHSPGADGRPLRILHVDDHALNRLLVRDILTVSGHDVAEAKSGEEALQQLGDRVFDLVLMDINMPGMNGVEVVRRLRDAYGPERHTPVIALTSEVRRRKADYVALGFNDFVAKPFLIADLLEAVGRCAEFTPASRPTVHAAYFGTRSSAWAEPLRLVASN